MLNCTNCKKVKDFSHFHLNKNSKRGYQNHCKECVNVSKKEYYSKNKNHILEQQRGYRKNNRPKINAKKMMRLSKIKKATPDWLTTEMKDCIDFLYEEAKILEILTTLKHEVDHIIPLTSDTVCGLHLPWNLRVIERSENRSKLNNYNSEYI